MLTGSKLVIDTKITDTSLLTPFNSFLLVNEPIYRKRVSISSNRKTFALTDLKPIHAVRNIFGSETRFSHNSQRNYNNTKYQATEKGPQLTDDLFCILGPGLRGRGPYLL